MATRYEYKFVRIGEGWLAARKAATEGYQSLVHESSIESSVPSCPERVAPGQGGHRPGGDSCRLDGPAPPHIFLLAVPMHTPVMLAEVVERLCPAAGGPFVEHHVPDLLVAGRDDPRAHDEAVPVEGEHLGRADALVEGLARPPRRCPRRGSRTPAPPGRGAVPSAHAVRRR